MTAKPDLAALTSLRGIAAWYVVLYHVRVSTVDLLPPPVIQIMSKGYLAVDFFFLLSGFVIWLSYRDRIAGNGVAALPRFFARRFARIYPLHFVILCGAVLFALLLAATGRASPESYPFHELPLHLLLIQNWGLTNALSWNDPAWSISVEMAAYLLFPLIALGTDWRALSTPVLLALIGLLALALHGYFVAMDAPILDSDIPRTGLVRCLIQFAIGTILCALWLRWRERPAGTAALILACGMVPGGLALAGLLPETIAVPLAFSGLLLAAALTANRARNPLAARPLHYLGEISYATYLVHFLLFVLFKLLFVDGSGQIGTAGLAGFLALTLIVSMLLYHIVERPAQRMLNRRFDLLLGRKAQTA
ncbi:acyltransferase [Parasphingopyxis algicola]|uniref:acyltransferase family protein n=1 Tax=Parasphingopyxis algicola TaxID=2026624 RepID=UPI0015A2CEED|nr:acyltransferase [Parasphingopyxis algicola]QLC26696.1 acyltransferase [Parasphingopyxis algicola]